MFEFGDFFQNVFGHVTGALIGAVIFATLGAVMTVVWINAKRSYSVIYWKERRALRRVLNLRRSQRVLIVLPQRSLPATSPSLHADFVAYEDMLASSLVERSFILAGWREEQIEIVTQATIAQNIALKSENMVLICSPGSNPLTQECLDRMRAESRLDCAFDEIPGTQQKERQLKFDGRFFDSPSYREAEALIANDRSPYEGTLTDYALLARFSSPWQPDRKVILVSGIRAIGTWGAARALRQRAEEIVAKSNGNDFAVLVHCKFEGWKIKEYELSDLFEVPPPR